MILPDIHCPIAPSIHPNAAEADDRTIRWMKRFSLCASDAERDRLSKSGCGRLAAHIVPKATSQALQIVSDFCAWNISFDDEYCDEGPLSEQPGLMARTLALIHRAVETPECTPYIDDRYALALYDIRCRLDAYASPEQMGRWLEAMRGWFLAETWKAGNIAVRRMPSIDEYATLRLYSGGALVFPVLACITESDVVPGHVLEERRVRALTEMAASLCSWMTDILSYEKEIEREQGGHNLVIVIQHEYQYSLEQAAFHAVDLYQQIMQLFLRLHSDVMQSANPALRRYLEDLGHLVRTALDWCLSSARYPQTVHVDKTATKSTPKSGKVFPADSIRSIAWWWLYDPARTSVESPKLEQSAGG